MGQILDALKRIEGKRDRVSPAAGAAAASARRAERRQHSRESSGQADEPKSRERVDERRGFFAKAPRLATAYEKSIRDRLQEQNALRQYRRLAASVRAELGSQTNGLVLLTSVGRTVQVAETIAHLGVLLAEQDQGDVLLVDANPIGAALSGRFEAASLSGLTEALRWDSGWADLVAPLDVDRLYLLPAGRAVLDSAETTQDNLARLLGQWEKAFPVLLADAGDADDALAIALGPLCRAAYFVVELGATDSLEAAAAVARLRARGVRVSGCVVTNAPE